MVETYIDEIGQHVGQRTVVLDNQNTLGNHFNLFRGSIDVCTTDRLRRVRHFAVGVADDST